MTWQGVAQFYKVGLERYQKDFLENLSSLEKNGVASVDGVADKLVVDIYNDIILPKRATKYSAGYDFFAPFDFKLNTGETIKIPTGIRCKMNEDIVLMIYPRSSLGFKYRMMLENTVGVIDSDYFNADNEGHIFIKFTNHGDKEFTVKKGVAFAQGIFTKYYLTHDDEVENIRSGGLGSTSA